MRWLGKMQAKLVLALLFFYHLLGKLLFFWRRPKGLQNFLDSYRADGIFPVGSNERSHFPTYQRCQVCSLCTFSCTAIQKGLAPADFEPKFVMLGYGGSSHESEIFLEEWLPCIECEQCSVLCPNDVPIHGMAQMIIERRKKVGFRN
ncbi:MAG: 4Fe-4S dicluster domain-containing protein [Deltaproteobacteria bacterium]|nr:4Fe-4S dicluster domain-containing protein [Deltaproteobacteria bacterium]